MNYYFNTAVLPLKIEGVIEQFKPNEFRSPYRSTVNLLSFMQSALFEDFLAEIDVDRGKAKFICEFKVPVIQGKGVPSHTDVMVEYGDRLIAVEAKNTEPAYDKVTKWLTPDNKNDVLDGWLQLINSKIERTITIDDVQELTYQMIHRLASACIDKNKRPELIYLYFNKNIRMVDYYLEQLRRLKSLVGETVKISLFLIENNPTDEQKTLQKRWDDGDRYLSIEVKTGLKDNNLYKFESNQFINIL